jgi:hypothetical protein
VVLDVVLAFTLEGDLFVFDLEACRRHAKVISMLALRTLQGR